MLLKELKLVEFTPIANLRDLGVNLRLPVKDDPEEGKKARDVDPRLEHLVKNFLTKPNPSPGVETQEIKKLLGQMSEEDLLNELKTLNSNVSFLKKSAVEHLSTSETVSKALEAANLDTDYFDKLDSRDNEAGRQGANKLLQEVPDISHALMSASYADSLTKKINAELEAKFAAVKEGAHVDEVLGGFFNLLGAKGLLKSRLIKAKTELGAQAAEKKS